MRPLLGLVPFVLMATLAAPAFAQATSTSSGTITISGVGEVTAAPDTALITSGVTTQGATAREALDANTAAMNDLIATLKASNIEARDIQTSGFSVNPNYVYSEERDANGYTLPPKITGYQVSNTVSVRVRALDTLGAVLDKAVTVGANTVNSVSFSVADPSALYNEARKSAFADAREKAGLYAEVAGAQLDDLVAISESEGYSAPQPFMLKSARADAPAPAPVPVEAGELTFSINVTVSWELDQNN